MPTFSYIVTPVPGKTECLVNELNSLPFCEAFAADNEELIILVTDSPDQTSERSLQKQLQSISSLQNLTMTFGHTGLRHSSQIQE